MKLFLLRFLPLFLLALAPLQAADDARTAKVSAADDERVAAVLAANRERLTAIFSDELRYTHSSGTVDNKTTYTEALTTGKTKYTGWSYDERSFTFPAPGIALMTGKAHVSVAAPNSGTNQMVLSFLGVYREEQGHWRFLAWQSCKIPLETKDAGK